MADDQPDHPLAISPSRSAKRLMCYVPVEYVEAMGLAAIGWAHLETAIDVIIALAAGALNRSYDGAASSSAAKIDQLLSLSTETALEHDSQIGIEFDRSRRAGMSRRHPERRAWNPIWPRTGHGCTRASQTPREDALGSGHVANDEAGSLDEAVAAIAGETRRALGLAKRISKTCAGPEFKV